LARGRKLPYFAPKFFAPQPYGLCCASPPIGTKCRFGKKYMEEKKNMENITIIAQTCHVELDGTATPGHTIAAADEYIVPVDPADETQCDSCQ
tara:strand:- start:114236 stop:114514 length:279 start_codon:yes stop_codon:yes gene_type:complete